MSKRQSPGRKPIIAGVSINPEPSAFATVTCPFRAASTDPGMPRKESDRSQRVAKSCHLPANDHIYPLQAFEGFDVNLAIMNGEIPAFHQGETKITSEIRVLEIRFIVRPGSEQNDARLLAASPRETNQVFTKDLKKWRQALHLAIAELVRKTPRRDDTILERISSAGRRLRAVREHTHHLPSPALARSTASK